MRTTWRIRVVVMVVAAIALTHWCVAWSQTLSVDGGGEGIVLVGLSEFGLSASLEGPAQWAGEVAHDDEPTTFSAEGTFRGFGVHDLLTNVTEAWLVYSAIGETGLGTSIDIRGLLHVKSESLIPLKAGDRVVGIHYTLLDLGGEVLGFVGEFEAAAAGEVVPGDAPLSLRLIGSASVHLAAEAIELSDEIAASIPLDHPALPAGFLDYITALFTSHGP